MQVGKAYLFRVGIAVRVAQSNRNVAGRLRGPRLCRVDLLRHRWQHAVSESRRE